MSYTLPDPGPPNLEFERPADRARIEQTALALEAHGFRTQLADSGAHARELVLAALPEGSEVHTSLSETLRELGITAEIEESGRYDSIRAKLKPLDRETQGREMRKLAAAPDYIVGSVHAITDDGCLPREFARMQTQGYPGSLLAKTLLLHREPGGRITVIFAPETLGF